VTAFADKHAGPAVPRPPAESADGRPNSST
jgi:hypothetical protein